MKFNQMLPNECETRVVPIDGGSVGAAWGGWIYKKYGS